LLRDSQLDRLTMPREFEQLRQAWPSSGLARFSPTTPLSIEPRSIRLYTLISGDSYGASRVTLVERIQAFEVNGKLVAMVPSRDTLFVTGSNNEAGLASVAALAEKHLEAPYSPSGRAG
jgi:hypothetical protein